MLADVAWQPFPGPRPPPPDVWPRPPAVLKQPQRPTLQRLEVGPSAQPQPQYLPLAVSPVISHFTPNTMQVVTDNISYQVEKVIAIPNVLC